MYSLLLIVTVLDRLHLRILYGHRAIPREEYSTVKSINRKPHQVSYQGGCFQKLRHHLRLSAAGNMYFIQDELQLRALHHPVSTLTSTILTCVMRAFVNKCVLLPFFERITIIQGHNGPGQDGSYR